MKIKRAVAYIDGASRGNPGPSAVGVVFQDESGAILKELSYKIGATTNNVAEYCALVTAMQEALILGLAELEIRTDSELLARQFNGQYKVKDSTLKVFSFLATHLRKGFKSVSVDHVPRELNKLADAQANKALDQEHFL